MTVCLRSHVVWRGSNISLREQGELHLLMRELSVVFCGVLWCQLMIDWLIFIFVSCPNLVSLQDTKKSAATVKRFIRFHCEVTNYSASSLMLDKEKSAAEEISLLEFFLIIRPKEISINWGHFSEKYISNVLLDSLPALLEPHANFPTNQSTLNWSWQNIQVWSRDTNTPHTLDVIRTHKPTWGRSILKVLKDEKKKRLGVKVSKTCLPRDFFLAKVSQSELFQGLFLSIQGHRTCRITENALFTVCFLSQRGPLMSWNPPGGDLNVSSSAGETLLVLLLISGSDRPNIWLFENFF